MSGEINNNEVIEEANDKFLIFALDKEEYGIEIRHVVEIVGLQPVTEVPEMPDYIKGIMNLRGKIIPIMDVRLKFRKPFREYHDRTCTIVVDIQNICVGLVVDAVSEVISIGEEYIVPIPEVGGSYQHKYVTGIAKTDGGVKLILDCENILGQDKLAILKVDI